MVAPPLETEATSGIAPCLFRKKLTMKFFQTLFFLPLLIGNTACQSPSPPAANTTAQQKERTVGGNCECCEAWKDGLPEQLDWQAQIAPPGEPGEPLELIGTIFESDGQTPAEGVILYVYHTDAEGNYSRGPDSSPCAKRHGLLRGWVKTGEDGRYRFRTIRPASYPGTSISQHIHPIVKAPGLTAYWIDEFLFDDDPNLTAAERNRKPQRGGSGIVELKKNTDGLWVGERDIVLVEW